MLQVVFHSTYCGRELEPSLITLRNLVGGATGHRARREESGLAVTYSTCRGPIDFSIESRYFFAVSRDSAAAVKKGHLTWHLIVKGRTCFLEDMHAISDGYRVL